VELSVVVPVYNSEQSLPELVERLQPVLGSAAEHFELILVNDASGDRSWEVVASLAAGHPWIRGVNLTRNYGQHNALLCGIRKARYETIVTMDDDLQNPPEEIPKLLEELDRGNDVVYGVPESERHGLFRDLASQVTKLALQRAMGAETARNISAFRAFRTQLREAFAGYSSAFVSIDVLLTWGTSRFAMIRVRHDRRRFGESNYTLRRLFTHTMNMLTGFTTLPLRFASFLGFALTVFGAGVLVYVVGRYLIQGTPVQGFPFLASTIAIFSGTQLFVLGIMGEYLARMHLRIMDKPTYLVREETGAE